MRQIGKLSPKGAAQTLADYLLTQGIPSKLEPAGGDPAGEEWILWGVNEDQIDRAREILAAYSANPNDPVYQRAGEAARALKKQQLAQKTQRERKMYDANRLWAQPRWRDIPVTAVLILISIAVALGTNFGANRNGLLDGLMYRSQERMAREIAAEQKPANLFQNLWNPNGGAAEFLKLEAKSRQRDILRGEVWRVFTPMFLHFGPLHLLFNMMWMYSLGGILEVRKGSWRLLLLVLIIAGVSNFIQAYYYGTNFGGMSGVVYGLFMYIWLRGVIDPGFGFGIHQQQFVLMMLWMFLGFSMPGMQMANGAHLGGAACGALLGVIGTQLKNWQQRAAPE